MRSPKSLLGANVSNSPNSFNHPSLGYEAPVLQPPESTRLSSLALDNQAVENDTTNNTPIGLTQNVPSSSSATQVVDLDVILEGTTEILSEGDKDIISAFLKGGFGKL